MNSQWHLRSIGDLEAVWDDYTGDGVRVGVYDNGVQAYHRDLRDNYDASLELTTVDAVPNSSTAGHGTAVAGIIAAADNDIYGIGVAYDVSLAGVDYIGDAFNLRYNDYLDVLRDTAGFDVVNFSWGQTPSFSRYYNVNTTGSQAARELEALQDAATHGRDGLGTIFVKAAGNYANDPYWQGLGVWGNANADGLNTSFELIVTGATSESGMVESYSGWGHNLLISAPAASITTDMRGGEGYSSTGMTSTFGGTSAAAPVVSGVVSLMLEANSDLHWQDVQGILASSADHTGSAFGSGPSGYEQRAWFSNDADTWNGGGMTFNENYGFGAVNAYAAVRMAEVWTRMHDDMQERSTSMTLVNRPDTPLPINDSETTALAVVVEGSGMVVEHLNVTVNLSHSWSRDLQLTLVAPDGTEMKLASNELPGSSFTTWTFGVASMRGVSAEGTWELRATDTAAGDEGLLKSIEIEFLGTVEQTDDVYTFTEDFMALQSAERERGSIAEEDGGRDWVNTSALHDGVQLTMEDAAAALRVQGSEWASFSGTLENFAGGDGADTVAGNAQDNLMLGMRGNDYLQGGSGADTLEGGTGQDQLFGGSDRDLLLGASGDDTLSGGHRADTLYAGDGDDRLFGGLGKDNLRGESGEDHIEGASGDDLITGDAGFDTLFGGHGNDSLNGGNQADRLEGGIGNDRLVGERGSDNLFGDAGQDSLFGGSENDWIYGGSGEDLINGGTSQDRLHGGQQGDILYGEGGFDRLEGQSGDDFLDGGNQADNLFGGDGDDTGHGGQGLDRLFGGNGNDALYGGVTGDGLFGERGNDSLYGGDGGDNFFAGSGNDMLYGGSGDDTMNAGSGFDLLHGGSGDDLLRGNFNADTFAFSGNFGNDTISDFDAFNHLEQIDLSGVSAISDFADLMANHLVQDGNDALITDGSGNSILIRNVLKTDLDSDDFLF